VLLLLCTGRRSSAVSSSSAGKGHRVNVYAGTSSSTNRQSTAAAAAAELSSACMLPGGRVFIAGTDQGMHLQCIHTQYTLFAVTQCLVVQAVMLHNPCCDSSQICLTTAAPCGLYMHIAANISVEFLLTQRVEALAVWCCIITAITAFYNTTTTATAVLQVVYSFGA
jgi:hypothetical protein